MSLLLDKIKSSLNNAFLPKDELLYNYESLVDLLEEMGLKEIDCKNKITYKFNDEEWISFIFNGTHIDMEVPIFTEVLKENKRNNPLYCLHIAYTFLQENCINTHEQGKAIESIGFMLSAYMSYITKYKFKSKRINWVD